VHDRGHRHAGCGVAVRDPRVGGGGAALPSLATVRGAALTAHPAVELCALVERLLPAIHAVTQAHLPDVDARCERCRYCTSVDRRQCPYLALAAGALDLVIRSRGLPRSVPVWPQSGSGCGSPVSAASAAAISTALSPELSPYVTATLHVAISITNARAWILLASRSVAKVVADSAWPKSAEGSCSEVGFSSWVGLLTM
jgi:hypothetical protein